MQVKQIIREIIENDILDSGIDLLVDIENLKKFVLDNEQKLKNLFKKYKNCRNCDLCKDRVNIIFGEGNPNSRLMIIGESPCNEEDKANKPFLGEKGELLTKILAAINLSRSEIYITDIVKCYTFNTETNERRTPNKIEIEACKEIIDEQINIIKPKVICTLGNTATKSLLNTEKEIVKIRGEIFKYRGFTLIPTFHPSFLLKQPSAKKLVWEDIKKIKKILEENIENFSE